MPSTRTVIPFFTDENVPDSVGNVLDKAGHHVTRLREVMERGTPDPVIAVACSRNGQVLISHDNDFRHVAKRLNITQRQYRKSLHRILLRCPEPTSSKRVMDALSLIEAEWKLIQDGQPMVIEINSGSIRTMR